MDRAAAPFAWLGGAAIIAAGLMAAAIAYHATPHLVWAVAYLVLVAGVVQYVLGRGQARLSVHGPRPSTIWAEWVLLNAGHVGVMAGTLSEQGALVVAGTVAYIVAMIWFALAVRNRRGGIRLLGYRVLVGVMLASSIVGVVLSFLGA